MPPLKWKPVALGYEEAIIGDFEHGTERTKHCAWCYIKTAAYRQTLVDTMRIVLD
jgi:hypothetical protein